LPGEQPSSHIGDAFDDDRIRAFEHSHELT